MAVVIAGIIWLNTSPQFGGKHSEADIARYEASGHYEEGVFVNLSETSMDMSLSSMWGMTQQMLARGGNKKPEAKLVPQQLRLEDLEASQKAKVTWFGHSTMLIMLDGKTLLIDPMFGEAPAPHPMLGANRYADELPIEIESLPHIDAILISHDHYDHLDYGSIQRLKDKCENFFMPLGVGAHLRAWGIPEDHITEMNWWDELDHSGLKFALTPARHFSGRGMNNRSTTLWGGWVIHSSTERIFFSGDSGYDTHFKEIGDKYGPFDLAMMECGQYSEFWAEIHMMPEEVAQAGLDVQAKKVMPIHWGAFTMAMHSWTDPVERFVAKSEELNVNYITPEVGAMFTVSDDDYRGSAWWEGVE